MITPDYQGFSKWVMRKMWDSYDIDCGDLQDAAVKHGIIKEVPYDPEKHGESEYDQEPGDPWYVFVES